MYSVSETCENGKLCVTSHPGIWAKEEDLLWPPLSSGIERHEIIAPEPNWTHYKCKVLRENIGNCKIVKSMHCGEVSDLLV